MWNNGDECFYIHNLQGDIIALVYENGNIAAKYSYDAWGNPISITDGQGNDVSNDPYHIANINPYRYRGYRYDSDTGLYYLQSRYYNPELGRFISMDDTKILMLTQGEVLGANLFAYCNNNPVMYSDPSWYMSISQIASKVTPSVIFALYIDLLYQNLAVGLTRVGLYVAKILTPIAAKAFWWKPWLIAGIVVGAVAIVTATVSILYNKQMNKTVGEILKTKKGSIKNAPLPPGGPNWKDLLNKTLGEIKKLAQKGVKGYKEIYKLLTDSRFNR